MTPNQLCRASTENLERLARFLGLDLPSTSPEYKTKLIAAILQHEMEERYGGYEDSGPITIDLGRRYAR